MNLIIFLVTIVGTIIFLAILGHFLEKTEKKHKDIEKMIDDTREKIKGTFKISEDEIVQASVANIINYCGENCSREGLQKTPVRARKAYLKIFEGYKIKPEDILTTFENEGKNQMVILKDIEFYSTCEHHLLPFFGKAHIAYIPGKKIVGISKLARILDIYARRMQNQERITQQVAEAIEKHLKPLGVAIVVEAEHLCMRARGVEKQNSVMVTSKLTGAFANNEKTRLEFFSLIKK